MLSKIGLLTLFLSLSMGIKGISQIAAKVTYEEVPENVKITVEKEYPGVKKILNVFFEANKIRYRVSIKAGDNPPEVILIDAQGNWLRKSSFIGMSETDLEVVMKVQEITNNMSEVRSWNKTRFPDNRLEYRIVINNKLYVWDADKNYVGQLIDTGLPATPDNIQQPKM